MNLGSAYATIDLKNSAFMSKLQQSEQAMNRLGMSGSKGLDGFEAGLGRTQSRIGALGTVAGGLGTVLAAPFAIGVRGAVDLEQSIANVNAALGGVDAGTLDQLSSRFQEIGVNSQFSAVQVAGVGEELAKAGFTTQEIMDSATQGVVDLAQATGADLTTATTGVVQAFSMWDPAIVGVTDGMTDATRVADILTVAANESSAGIEDIIGGMRPLGPIASSMGIGYDEAAAAIAVFTNAGLKGADAGISLARGLQNLADPTSDAATMMGDLGIAAFDTQGNFIGFPSLFDQLKGSMGGMSDQAQLTALSTIFGAEAMDVMGLAILNGADPLEQMIALMGESGAAAEQSAIRMDTLGAQFDTLKEGVSTLLASFVTGLIPGFRFVVDVANLVIDALMRIPEPIKTIIGALAGLTIAFAALTLGPQILGGLLGTIGLGTGVFAGFGAALSTLIGPALAVAAVAGTLYLAWRTNFLGIRDLVGNVIGGVTGFFGDLKDTWDDVWSDLDGPTDFMKRLNKINGVADEAAKYGNRFARVLATIGGVMKRLSGTRFLGWLGKLGTGFTKAGQFVEGFLDTWNALGRSRTMQTVERWGNVTPKLGDGFDLAGRALRSFSGGLKAIRGDDTPAWLVDVALGADRLAGGIERAGETFRQMREAGINPVVAGMAILANQFPVLAPALAPALAAFDQFTDGNYAEGFRQVGQSIQGIAGIIGDVAIAAESWVLNVGAPAVGGWLLDLAADAWGALKLAAGWVGTFTADIAGWTLDTDVPAITGWVSTAAADVWAALSTAAGWVWDGLVDLGGWTLETAVPAVTGWIVTAAGNVWYALKTAAGWAWDGLVELGSWTLNTAIPTVTGWIVTAAANVWDALKTAAGWAWDGLADLGAWTVDTAIPNVTGWITTASANVWEALKTAAGWAWDGIADIGTITLNVAGWLVEAAEDAWSAIKRFVTGSDVNRPSSVASGTSSGQTIDWPMIRITIQEFFVDVDLAGLNDEIEKAFQAEATADPASLAAAEAAGREQGKGLGDRFFTALSSGLTGGGGGGGLTGGEGGSAGGIVGMQQQVRAYLEGAFSGMGESFNEIISPQIQSMSDDLAAGLQGVANDGFADLSEGVATSSENLQGALQTASDLIALAWSDLTDELTFDLPDVSMPDFQPLVDALTLAAAPFIAVFIGVKDGIVRVWDELKALEFDAPEFSFPDWPYTLEDIPFYSEGKAMIDEIKAFFADPWGGAINVAAPVLNWGASDGREGSAAEQAQSRDAREGSYQGGGGSAKGDRFMGAGNGFGSLTENAGKYGRPGGGGGGAGAGMFSSLMTEIDSVLVKIAEISTAMTTFNSGPLTTLNAGFPILGTTVLAFNSGPLTTLNAAFPILTASMTAFNAGPLTTLNAGFPILAATILAFNAGPLTTLNAAWPILTASVTAFNLMGLTVLNAGFPILAATILAFNAGPLTTLNAAFPILTASMVAFNLLGLTVLNAGFPLLGATIIAFNAGPLTTLNAAFPILTASMVACNVGGLTLLNAGFPILGATILAFNSGPLTTLNAAFPILVASMATLDTAMATSGANVTTFGGTVDTMVADVSGGFAEMASSASTEMASVETSIETAMSNASSSISSEAATWPGIIAGQAGGMSSSGFAVGYAGGMGVVRGLNSTLGQVRSTARTIVAEATAAMRVAGEIRSPSRVTARIGAFLSSGLAVGMTSEARKVQDAAQGIVDIISSTFGKNTIVETFDRSLEALARRLESTDYLPRSFWDNLSGPWLQSRSGTWNKTARTGTEMFDVLADALWAVVDDGETRSDAFTHLPYAVRDAVEPIADRLVTKMDANWRDVTHREAVAYRDALIQASRIAGISNASTMNRLDRMIGRSVSLTEAQLRLMSRDQRLDYRGRTYQDLYPGSGVLRFINSGKWLESANLNDLHFKSVTLTASQLRARRYAEARRAQQSSAATRDASRPNTGGRGNTTTYIDQRQYYELRRDEYKRVIDGAEDGRIVRSEMRNFPGTHATRTVGR